MVLYLAYLAVKAFLFYGQHAQSQSSRRDNARVTPKNSWTVAARFYDVSASAVFDLINRFRSSRQCCRRDNRCHHDLLR
jgi:hypothetical protein